MIEKIFARVWRRRLAERSYGKPMRIIRVKGWRSALVDGCGGRHTVTFMFRIGRWYV